jgi:hypothetical protein
LLKVFAWNSLFIAFASALSIKVDETGRRQKMAVMNVVWPNELVAAASGLERSDVARSRARLFSGAFH